MHLVSALVIECLSRAVTNHVAEQNQLLTLVKIGTASMTCATHAAIYM